MPRAYRRGGAPANRAGREASATEALPLPGGVEPAHVAERGRVRRGAAQRAPDGERAARGGEQRHEGEGAERGVERGRVAEVHGERGEDEQLRDAVERRVEEGARARGGALGAGDAPVDEVRLEAKRYAHPPIASEPSMMSHAAPAVANVL